MKKTYQIDIYSNACGLHCLQKHLEFTGTKTGAIKKAREEKKLLKENGICNLPLQYKID